MVGLLLTAFLAVQAWAQPVVLAEFCGVNNEADPAAIKSCQSQDAINVESDKNGTTLRKRGGTSPFLTLGAGTAVNSIFALKNNSGNECLIIANNTGTLYRSVNSGSAVSFSTITSGARLFCQQDSGKAYCFTSSNDTPFSYDCQTYYSEQQANGYPNGKFNAFTQDRQLIAGTTDFPNRLYVSQAGAVSTYTGGTDEISSFTEDIGRSGDKITGVHFINGRVIVFKEYSIGGFNIQNQFDSTYYDISNRVGITGPEAVLNHDGYLYFKGSDNEFYRMTGAPADIEKLSGPLRRTISAVLTGKTRYVVLTEKADWDAGNYIVQGALAPMSGTIEIGSVVPASATFADTSSSNFSGSLVKTSITDSVGSVTLSSSVVSDDFSNGSMATPLPWTVTAGNWSESGGELITGGSGADNTIYTSSSVFSSGTWKVDWTFPSNSGATPICSETSGICLEIKFIYAGGGDYYSFGVVENLGGAGTHDVFLAKYIAGTRTYLSYATGITFSESRTYALRMERSSATGTMAAYIDSVMVSSTPPEVQVTSSTRFEIFAKSYIAVGVLPEFDNFYFNQYLASGSYVSRIFDTGFSTPTAGPLSATATFTNGETAIFYDVRNSTSPNNDLWTAFAASSDTLNVGLNKRYWQYRARFWTQVSTKTPSLDAISLPASTTGQYITSCVEPGTGITSWGALELGGVFSGGGTNFTVEDSTGTTCSDPSIGNKWTATSTGTTISIATAAAYKVRVTFNIGSASDTARMDNMTVNWTEGSVAPPSYVSYWDDGIYFAISTGTTGNNRLIKYDLRNGSLWPFDLGMNSPVTFNNIMYFGSTSTAKVLKYSANDPDQAPSSDDGSPINAYWRSKQFTTPDPFTEKSVERIGVVARKEAAGTLTTSWRINSNTNSGSFNVNLSTGQAVVRHNYRVPVGQVAGSYDIQVGNNSVYRFEVLGLRMDLSPKEWRPLP